MFTIRVLLVGIVRGTPVLRSLAPHEGGWEVTTTAIAIMAESRVNAGYA